MWGHRRFSRAIDKVRVRAAIDAAERLSSGQIVVSVSPWFWGSVEKVAWRAFSRLHVSNTCQQKRSEQFAVGQAVLNAMRHLFQEPVSRSFFEQSHQGLDLGLQLNKLRIQLCLRPAYRRQSG